MARHYFTHSFSIDTGGDTSNLPPVEDLSIVVEGLFFSSLPQTGESSVTGAFQVTGLRGVHGASSESVGATFYYNQSATVVQNVYFPVRGKTNEGEGISFTLSPSGGSPQPVAQVTVWGYYTDE